MWEVYLKPALQKAERLKAARDGKPAGPAFEPKTEEEVLLALSMLGLAPPEAK